MNDEIVTVDRHLYLTEDRSRVVEEGDPDGRWLWASPGTQVKRRDAEHLGALDEKPAPEPEENIEEEQQDKPEPKQRAPRANKQRAKPADKAT